MNVYERLHAIHRLLRYRLSAELAELKFLARRRIEGGSVLDVGAFRGVYSYWMHRQFRESRIVAFEPQPEMTKSLLDFKQTFGLNRLQVEPLGLSSRPGTLQMHRPQKHWAAATVDEYCIDTDETDVFEVPVTTIDNYLAEHPELRPVRFIKCDVGCHEADVLAGAEQTLIEDRPELLVEWSTPRRTYRERMFRLAERLGYAIYQFEFGRMVECTSAERHSPPSRELGAHYVMLPREAMRAAA